MCRTAWAIMPTSSNPRSQSHDRANRVPIAARDSGQAGIGKRRTDTKCSIDGGPKPGEGSNYLPPGVRQLPAADRRDGHGQSISDIAAVRDLMLASQSMRRVTPEPLEEPRGSRGLSPWD